MKNTVLILLILCGSLTAKASISADSSKNNSITFVFDRVNQQELEMKTCPLDSSASAMYILDAGSARFEINRYGIHTNFARIMRIKIFKNSGYKHATFKINALKFKENDAAFGSASDLVDINGYTHNLVDGKIVTDTLLKEEIFKKDLSDRVCQYTFTMPKVKEGSVIDVYYNHLSLTLLNMQGWTFQRTIPVKQSWYEFEHLSKTLEFRVLLHHKDPMVLNDKIYYENGFQGAGAIFSKHNWVMADLPALKEEPYLSSNIDNADRLELQISKILKSTAGGQKDFCSTWEALRKTLMKDENFGEEIKSFGKLREVANAIKAQNLDKLATVKQAFEFVRKNIHWNEDESLTTDKALKKAVEVGIGNSAEINLCLLSLLKELNIEAKPVILSTRSNGKLPDEPFLNKFNYVIVRVTIDGQDWMLDATDPYLDLGVLPIRCLNQRGYLLDKEEGRWISLMPIAKHTQFTQNDFVLTPENKWEGTLSIGGQGYYSQSIQEQITKTGLDQYKEDFRKTHGELDIAEVQINYKEVNKPELVCNVKTSEGIQIAGSRLYVKPIIVNNYGRNPFQYPKRENPVDFATLTEDTYLSNLNIPAGYIIEEMPTDFTFALPNDSAKFTFSISKTGNKLSITSQIQIKKIIFSPNEYSALRSFYEQIINKHQEMIVLKKMP